VGVTAAGARIEILKAGPEREPLIGRLLELYQHDFSEFDGDDVDDDGTYGSPYLPAYWQESGRHPYLLRVDGHWAGCALVHSGPPHDMAEFFVMRKYRGGGVGAAFARDLFARFPGEWTVREIEPNTPAQAFWRRVIPVPFTEDAWDQGPMQRFTIGPS
jgi:predicted acetyltransferase